MNMDKNSSKLYTGYTVIFRIGGPLGFEWRKTLGSKPYDMALTEAREIERMGYKTLIHETHLLNSIGMPETWE